jgi:putative tryptophan/tyrosine transport system substrate-binding protein
MSTDLQTAARKLGVELHVAHARTKHELPEVFANLARLRADGLVIAADVFLAGQCEQLASLALHYSMPAIFEFREFVAAGGLMTYGTIHAAPYREWGNYTGKVLGGVNPGDLPVRQSTKIELIINLRTAKAMGVTVPISLLARADDVIE